MGASHRRVPEICVQSVKPVPYGVDNFAIAHSYVKINLTLREKAIFL